MRWILIVCLLAAGCSALPKGAELANEQVGGGILRITVPKSNLSHCSSADECTLVKAAEATQRAGGTHFMVLPGHAGSTQVGHAYIKVFNFGAGERVPSGAISVEEALAFIRKPQAPVAG